MDKEIIIASGEVCYDDAGGIIDVIIGDIIVNDDIEFFKKFKKYDEKQVELILRVKE